MSQRKHTAEFESCIEQVMKQGHDKGSAFAICTESFKKAAKAIFVGEAEQIAGGAHPCAPQLKQRDLLCNHGFNRNNSRGFANIKGVNIFGSYRSGYVEK